MMTPGRGRGGRLDADKERLSRAKGTFECFHAAMVRSWPLTADDGGVNVWPRPDAFPAPDLQRRPARRDDRGNDVDNRFEMAARMQ